MYCSKSFFFTISDIKLMFIGATATLDVGQHRAILRSAKFDLPSPMMLNITITQTTFGSRVLLCPDITRWADLSGENFMPMLLLHQSLTRCSANPNHVMNYSGQELKQRKRRLWCSLWMKEHIALLSFSITTRPSNLVPLSLQFIRSIFDLLKMRYYVRWGNEY